MRRYWWPDDETFGAQKELKIQGDLFRHIFIVCRRRVGDCFEILSDKKAFLVEVKTVDKKSALVDVKSSRELPLLKRPYVHLVLSFSNPKVIDRVLEKSVELGVKSFQLVSSKNSFLKDQKGLETKTKRAAKIIQTAMQQSGRGETLELKAPIKLVEFLEEFKSKKSAEGYMFYEEETKGFMDLETLSKKTQDIYILVGSEGGFTDEESRLAQNSGFKSISLGDQILRVETACIASISILKSSYGIW